MASTSNAQKSSLFFPQAGHPFPPKSHRFRLRSPAKGYLAFSLFQNERKLPLFFLMTLRRRSLLEFDSGFSSLEGNSKLPPPDVFFLEINLQVPLLPSFPFFLPQ